MTHLLKASSGDKGTLTYIKNRYNHRNAGMQVMQAFSHCEHLLNFATDGLVIALGCNMLHFDNMDATGEQLEYEDLKTIASKIVDRVWCGPTTEIVESVLDAFHQGQSWDSSWCVCEEGT